MLPTQGNCVVETFFRGPYTSEDSAAFEILSSLFLHLGSLINNHELLLKHVIKKGFALRTGSQFHPLLGSISMFSEGDPHTLKTFENFERVYQTLAEGSFR